MPAHPPQQSLDEVISELQRLTGAFEASTLALGGEGHGSLAFAEVREHLATAGRQLVRLIGNGRVGVPSPTPPWLRWSLRMFGRRPHFERVDVCVGLGKWWRHQSEPRMSLKRIIGVIDGHRLLSDNMLLHRGDYGTHRYRHRHVFIEAVAGWLGRSLGLRPLLRTPFVHAFPHLAFGPPAPSVELCIDWSDRPAEVECRFFLDVSRACTQVCRRLADDLGSMGKLVVPVCTSAEAAIVTCQTALRRWHEWLPKIETHAGSRMIFDLTHLRYMHWGDSSEVELLTYSAATACIDLAKLVPLVRDAAVRLAARLRAVPSWITADPTTIVVELEEQLRLAAQLEGEIAVAAVDLEVEALTTWAKANEPQSNRSEKVALKFARTPDAKHKCLEALVAAPTGIPTHDQIAKAISLEHQTVKEAMQKLRGAGHVDKIAGVWVTTTKGREHLKLLLGE